MGRYPFQALVRRYLEDRQPFLAESTLVERKRKLEMLGREIGLLHHEGRISTEHPEALTRKDVGVLIGTMRAKRLDEETQRGYLARLGSFLQWCGNPVIQEMRAEGLLPHTPRKPIRSLNEAELKRLELAAARIPGWPGEVARFITAAYPYTGLRPSELRRAEITDVSTEAWTIWVRHPKGEHSYGKKRTVPILGPARPAVIRFMAKREEYLMSVGQPSAKPLIPTMQHGKATVYAAQVLWRLKHRIEEESGVVFALKHLRSTYGQQILDRDSSKLTAISLAMGHSSTRTTEQYYVGLKEENMIRELSALFVPEGPSFLEKPKTRTNKLIESERYLSGYA